MPEALTAAIKTVGDLMLAVDEAERQLDELRARLTEVRAENDHLRATAANGPGPCLYCALPKERWAECGLGFPGCDRGDDAMLCPHIATAMAAMQECAEARAALESLPDWQRFLNLIRDAFESHGFWRRRCEGTPLANDLPVRAANLYLQIRQEAVACVQTKENQS